MSDKKFTVEVEKGCEGSDGRPSVGPVYRNAFAKDGLPPLIPSIDSCWDVFRMSVEKNPKNKMLGTREIVDGGNAGKYKWQTYQEVYDVVLKVGNSIRSCGYGEGMKCGIYGANSAGWIISMEACNAHGLYCVPLYDTLGAGAVEFIICHAEVSIAFVEEKKIPELLKTFPNAAKYLKTIVSFGTVTPQQKQQVEQSGSTLYSWDEFLQVGQNQSFDLPVKKRSDICTLMYTSGTTGDPKGVMISNEAILTIILGVQNMLESSNNIPVNEKDVFMSYLPLAHIFDRVVEEVMIMNGASIGFWRGDVKLLMDDLGELKPSIFIAVPRVLDRVYSGLQQRISTGGFVKQTMFNFAYSYKLSNLMKGVKHEEASPRFDRMVFAKVKQALGGNVRVLLSGAAPLARHVEVFLRVVTCCCAIQGYGLTESCAGSFVSIPNEIGMLGTIGPPLPYVDARLESVPEMGYDALASTPRGEICIRGKSLFSGYYKHEELTKEVMVGEWFHTGDIGEWQPDGAMKIIDRKKNIFKLSQGEYVAVEHLENIYGQTSAIESVWVYGNSFEFFLVAVVNPKKEALESWAKENDITMDFNSLCGDSRAKGYIVGELTKVARAKKLKGFEIIKQVHLDPVPFDIERDLITPTFKKRRPQMLKYYQKEIDAMYKSESKPSG